MDDLTGGTSGLLQVPAREDHPRPSHGEIFGGFLPDSRVGARDQHRLPLHVPQTPAPTASGSAVQKNDPKESSHDCDATFEEQQFKIQKNLQQQL